MPFFTELNWIVNQSWKGQLNLVKMWQPCGGNLNARRF